MTVTTATNTMLYCPKCQQTYEDAVQRFCLNDGARLLPVASADKPANQAGGVFSTILNRKAEGEADKFASAPRFSKADRAQFTRPTFQPPLVSKIFKPEAEIEPTVEPTIESQPKVEAEPIVFEPLPYLTDSEDVLEIETPLDEEKTASVEIVELTAKAGEIETFAAAAGTPIPAPTFPLPETQEVGAPKPNGRVLPPLPDEDKLEYTGVKTANGKATEKLAWEKRSPEMPNEPTAARTLLSVLGVAVLLAILWGVWSYFLNRPAQPIVIEPTATESPVAPEQTAQNITPTETNTNVAPLTGEADVPPPRTVTQPNDTIFFQNSKENLKGEPLKNYLGFSLYYPKDWTRNDAKNNFLDVSKTSDKKLPIEQFLVSYYNSKGTFEADEKNFAEQVRKTNVTLKKIVPNYRLVSQGERAVNSGWRAYEIKFQGTGKTASGEKITLWGRRLFVPAAARGMKNGYVITMLATSLSKEVESVEDVGVKGESAMILETFEPNQSF